MTFSINVTNSRNSIIFPRLMTPFTPMFNIIRIMVKTIDNFQPPTYPSSWGKRVENSKQQIVDLY